MSVIATAVKHMLAAGMDHEAIVAAVSEMEAVKPQRSKAAERTRRWREKRAETVTVTSPSVTDHHGDENDAASRAQVVIYTPPSEELITPLKTPSGSIPPKPRKASKRVPEDWSPSPATWNRLEAEGATAGDLERALTRMRDHEFRSARQDWDATFRNWVRDDRDRGKANGPNHHGRPSDRDQRLGDCFEGLVAAVNERR